MQQRLIGCDAHLGLRGGCGPPSLLSREAWRSPRLTTLRNIGHEILVDARSLGGGSWTKRLRISETVACIAHGNPGQDILSEREAAWPESTKLNLRSTR
jgi:hypothetical protein